MRKAFNFFNSYWCIANELSDKDRLQFYDALMLYEFTGDKSKIDALTGMAKFAYVSQAHSIDSQINGYLDVCKRHGNKPFEDPTLPPTLGATLGATPPPTLQVKEKEKVKEKEQEQGKGKEEYIVYRQFDHLKITQAEFDTLAETYSHDEIEDVLNQIQNYTKNKQYKSLYLTALTWLRRDAKRKETAPTEKLNTFANFKLPQ